MSLGSDELNPQIIADSCQQSLQSVEETLNQLLKEVEANPNGVSQSLLMRVQTEVQVWATLVNTESSIIKQFGDALKQVATNIGT